MYYNELLTPDAQ